MILDVRIVDPVPSRTPPRTAHLYLVDLASHEPVGLRGLGPEAAAKHHSGVRAGVGKRGGTGQSCKMAQAGLAAVEQAIKARRRLSAWESQVGLQVKRLG